MNIHYGDILVKYREVIDVTKQSIPYIKDANKQDFRNQLLQNGDVIFADAAEDNTVGKATEVYNLRDHNLVSGLHTIVARPKVSFVQRFLGYSLNTEAFHKQLIPLIQGTKISSINKGNLASCQLSFPKNKNEQEKIAELFEKISNLISLHQRKLDKLRALKESYLSKMFPAEGENKPELRFKGFTDAWEQRKLESMATFSKGCGYSKSDLIDSGHEVILYGRLYTSYETVISSVNTYVELNDKSAISVGGEVIVPATGESPEDIARASVVEKEGMALGGDLNIIRPKSSLDSVFLALSISNGGQKKELSKRAQGKSVVHLHNSDLKEVIILYPKVEEQSKISDLFISFDSLISHHQRKLDKLKSLKEAYLAEMFV